MVDIPNNHPIFKDSHFNLILDFYKVNVDGIGIRAKKSNVPYINHIVEGLIILQHIYASIETMRAFCLHPIVQADLDYLNSSKYLNKDLNGYSVLLACEYRRVANAYLSYRSINNISEIELSSFIEVNQMLIADKVQNYKDFEKYQTQHVRKRELKLYFENWIERLGINYPILKSLIDNHQ